MPDAELRTTTSVAEVMVSSGPTYPTREHEMRKP
jgi:hypothetical protein